MSVSHGVLRLSALGFSLSNDIFSSDLINGQDDDDDVIVVVDDFSFRFLSSSFSSQQYT